MLVDLPVSSEACGVVPMILVVMIDSYYLSNLGVTYVFADLCDFSDESSAKIVVTVFSLKQEDVILADGCVEHLDADVFVAQSRELVLFCFKGLVIDDELSSLLNH